MILGKFVDLNRDGTPDELIVEWNQIQTRPASPSTMTFEAVLQLNSGASPGKITFDYANLDTGNATFSNGASATVGIEATALQPADRLLVSFKNGSNPLGIFSSGSLPRPVVRGS